MAFMRRVEAIVGPKSGDGVTIDALKISFRIEKSDEPEPDASVIRLYNLSPETSVNVSAAGCHIQLRAGYEDESIRAIFFGTVLKGIRYKDGSDFITELQAHDGRAELAGARVSGSFAKNGEAAAVAQAFLDAIDLPSKGLDRIPEGAEYPSGFCFIGTAGDGLKKVLNRFDLSYTVKNEMLYIIKDGEAVERAGLKLTPETGLLTTPQPVSDKTAEGDLSAEPANRQRFSTMLFPELVPGAACKIETPSFTGEVVIKKAVYEGDNRDGNFKIEIEAEAL
jgi:hypothetical protein